MTLIQVNARGPRRRFSTEQELCGRAVAPPLSGTERHPDKIEFLRSADPYAMLRQPLCRRERPRARRRLESEIILMFLNVDADLSPSPCDASRWRRLDAAEPWGAVTSPAFANL